MPERRKHQRTYAPATVTAFERGVHVGDYLVQDLSAGGARLVGGPGLPVGTRLALLVLMLGEFLVELEAVVLRKLRAADGLSGIAVSFEHANAASEAAIQEVVRDAIADCTAPSVLVVHRSSAALISLAAAVLRTGRRALLAFTPLEATRWLTQEAARVEATLVSAAFVTESDGAFFSFVRDEFPAVRRVVVYDVLPPSERERARMIHAAEAALSAPWTPSRVGTAIGLRGRSGGFTLSVPPTGT